jgi:hypothetical protein
MVPSHSHSRGGFPLRFRRVGLSEQDAVALLESEGFGDGEEVVVVDTGVSVASKNWTDFIATDAALYVFRSKDEWRGEILLFRLPYELIADVKVSDPISDSGGRRHYFEFMMLGVVDQVQSTDARVGYIDLSLSNGRLQEYVNARAQFRTTSPYHVSWDETGRGMTFGVLIEEGVPRIATCVYDHGVDEEDLSTRSIGEQEQGELQVALGLQPGFAYKRPRPEWMPRSVWNPPLPSPHEWMEVPKRRRRRFYDKVRRR